VNCPAENGAPTVLSKMAHQLLTKCALSADDDKGIILPDRIITLAHAWGQAF